MAFLYGGEHLRYLLDTAASLSRPLEETGPEAPDVRAGPHGLRSWGAGEAEAANSGSDPVAATSQRDRRRNTGRQDRPDRPSGAADPQGGGERYLRGVVYGRQARQLPRETAAIYG